MPTYNPAKVSVVVDSAIMIAKGESTFVKAEHDEDRFSKKMSSDGPGTRVFNPNFGGSIEVTLLRSSPANDSLEIIAAKDEADQTGVVSVSVEDGTGTAEAFAQAAWVKKKPALERAKEDDEVTWIFDTTALYIKQGGTNQLP